MTSIAHTAPADRLQALLLSRWVWCLLALLVYMHVGIGFNMKGLPVSLGDTDDATRLLQVRRFMAGAGWYDMTLPGLGGATPLVSHWSRLLDVPLALLFGSFSLFLEPALAELVVRALWPLMVLAVFLRLLMIEAEARAGQAAGFVLLGLSVVCLTGLYQFTAGRIDHHNVMIACTVIGVLRLFRSVEQSDVAASAGVLLGLGLVIGYEPLALTIPVVGALAAAAIVFIAWLPALRVAVVALAVTLLIGHGLTASPSRWLSSPCDAIGLNMVLLFGVGAATLFGIERLAQGADVRVRLGLLAAGGCVGAALYTVANPACLAGPFGAVGPEAVSLWLAHVIESKPLLTQRDEQGVVALTYLFASALALALAVRRQRQRRDVDSTLLLAVHGLGILLTLWMMKFMAYSSFIGTFIVALAIAEFASAGRASPGVVRVAGPLLLGQLPAAVLAVLLQPVLLPAPVVAAAAADADRCMETAPVRALAALPAGRMVAHWNVGPYIAALTPHAVLSGPYHRIDQAIVQTHRIFAATPAEAEHLLRAAGADYIVQCMVAGAGIATVAVPTEPGTVSLQGRLLEGHALPFLEDVPLAGPASPLRVWKLRPPS